VVEAKREARNFSRKALERRQAAQPLVDYGKLSLLAEECLSMDLSDPSLARDQRRLKALLPTPGE
jgi:hypothetical protein